MFEKKTLESITTQQKNLYIYIHNKSGGKARKRETDRQTDKHTDRQTDREEETRERKKNETIWWVKMGRKCHRGKETVSNSPFAKQKNIVHVATCPERGRRPDTPEIYRSGSKLLRRPRPTPRDSTPPDAHLAQRPPALAEYVGPETSRIRNIFRPIQRPPGGGGTTATPAAPARRGGREDGRRHSIGRSQPGRPGEARTQRETPTPPPPPPHHPQESSKLQQFPNPVPICHNQFNRAAKRQPNWIWREILARYSHPARFDCIWFDYACWELIQISTAIFSYSSTAISSPSNSNNTRRKQVCQIAIDCPYTRK